MTTVYPRTGGGNTPKDVSSEVSKGLSPHGRGKPILQQLLRLRERSIPARAGETEGYLPSLPVV